MILWRAKYGYCYPYNSQGNFVFTNLSQITFTDDGPFGIITAKLPESGFKFAGINASISASATPSVKYNSIGALAVGLEQLLGEDYYKLYMYPAFCIEDESSSSSEAFGWNILSGSVPSATLACPNLFDLMLRTTVDYNIYGCVYLQSLKKIIMAGNVYNVLDNGNILLLYEEPWSSTGIYGPSRANYPTGNQGNSFFYCGALWNPEYDGTKESFFKLGHQTFLQWETSDHWYWEYCINYGSNQAQVNFYNALFADFVEPDWSDDPPPPEPDDPNGNIDVDGGLPGGYDPDSDEIPWDVPNWLSASDLGMCTVYNPTVAQVKALATRLYSKDFQSGFENYIWGNPIESIIGLSVFPCTIPNGGTATVRSWGLDTGVTMTLAGSTLIHVNCGSLPVPNPYEGYLDYSPYTQAEIYIPYVGFVGLDADDIMSQNLQLHYYIDIISGSATVKLVISNTSTTTVLGQWSCQVGRQIPIGSKDYNDIINAGIQLVAAAVGAYSGSVIPEVVTDLDDALQYEGGGFNGVKFGTQMLRAGSSAIMQAKPNITRGSAIASASGQLAVQYPYLILKRPVSAKTNGYGVLVGYPTFKYGNIGSFSGFVRCQNIKLDGIGCTDWELSEIFRLCLEGVYI